MMPLSVPAQSECPATCFHNCISMSLEKKVSTICTLLNRAPSRVAEAFGECQKPGELGFQVASKTEQMVAEIGPVALFQQRGSLERAGAISLRTLRILRLVSKSNPRRIVIHSLICSTLVATCGTRVVPKNREAAQESWFAHIALTCVAVQCGRKLERRECPSS